LTITDEVNVVTVQRLEKGGKPEAFGTVRYLRVGGAWSGSDGSMLTHAMMEAQVSKYLNSENARVTLDTVTKPIKWENPESEPKPKARRSKKKAEG